MLQVVAENEKRMNITSCVGGDDHSQFTTVSWHGRREFGVDVESGKRDDSANNPVARMTGRT